MSLVQRLVSPKLPTALANYARVDLPGYDLWLCILNNVHILPTRLDIPTFEEALSKTLQLYPHSAGQLRSSGGRWFVELTNTPISVDTDYKLDTTADALLDGDSVVQDDLSSFLNHQAVSPCPVDGDAPLLRLKLTFFDNETSIGVTWHHALGDADLLSRFTHTLSQFYQGLPPLYPPPTFKKYHFATPSASMSAEFWPRLTHLHHACPLTELVPVYVDFLQKYQHLKWRFEIHDLDALRSILSSREECYVSKQDCLSAHIVAALNLNTSKPVRMIANVSNYRHISAHFIAEDIAGNMMQNVPAIVPPDMAGIATALRQALIQCREPEYIYSAMSVANDYMLDIANAGKVIAFMGGDDTVVTVNSNLVIDWCGAHFGCPEGTRFYTFGMAKDFLRCFRSNPVRGDDGVWRSRQSVDIAMGVKAELRPKLLETLSRGFQYILDSERTQL